jgi:hypothetical protein
MQKRLKTAANVQKKKKSVYGGSVKTHIEASGEEQPVSD